MSREDQQSRRKILGTLSERLGKPAIYDFVFFNLDGSPQRIRCHSDGEFWSHHLHPDGHWVLTCKAPKESVISIYVIRRVLSRFETEELGLLGGVPLLSENDQASSPILPEPHHGTPGTTENR